jgi:hypothetical protein
MSNPQSAPIADDSMLEMNVRRMFGKQQMRKPGCDPIAADQRPRIAIARSSTLPLGVFD